MDVSILHLEDNPEEAFFVRRHLGQKKPEYQVTWVLGKTAFRNALAGNRFDVILSDYRLPDWDGDGVLGYALWHYPNIPVIVLTGELGMDRAPEMLCRGAADYVTKADLVRLVPSIDRVLREAAGRPRTGAELGPGPFLDGPLPKWAFDPETLQLLDANRAAVEAFGYTREEVPSMTVDRLWAQADEARFRWHLGALRLNRQATFRARHRRRDGTLFEASVHWSDLERKGRRICIADVSEVTSSPLA